MSLLLKGGIVLIHDDNDTITPTPADVLVDGDRISKIGPDISPPAGCEVIDCTNKIISPGFVDTHHHVWDVALKGMYGDSAFVPYLGIMSSASYVITPEDIFWANLGGSMQAIDAGTTTTLDYAHMNWSARHGPQGVAGTLSSGIRSIFAYAPTITVAKAQPSVEFANPMPLWVMETFEQIATAQPLTEPNSRVKMGLGFDFYFLPEDVVKGIFDKARSLGANIITSHFIRFWGGEAEGMPAMLKRYGFLDERIVLAHAGCATDSDLKLLREANAFVSVTPNTEQAMAVGPSVAFRDDGLDTDKICSLGVDCASATSSSIVNEMRMGLQSARGLDSAAHRSRGSLPRKAHHTTAEAFNMGTIQGARALCMEDDIGSIKVGKKADLLVFDALSPAMISAAQKDPVMAIVLHSDVGDIETVIVDGQVRKRDGKLMPVEVTEWMEEKTAFEETGKNASWKEVAMELLGIQKRFLDKLPECNVKEVEAKMAVLYHLPDSK